MDPFQNKSLPTNGITPADNNQAFSNQPIDLPTNPIINNQPQSQINYPNQVSPPSTVNQPNWSPPAVTPNPEPSQPYTYPEPAIPLLSSAQPPASQLFMPSSPPYSAMGADTAPNEQLPSPNIYPGMMQPIPQSQLPNRPKLKRRPIIISIIMLFLVLTSGYVFGLYLPNQPNNVYKTGLNRSAMALNKLITTATEKSKLQSFKKSDFSLTIDAKYADVNYSGTFDAKFDTSKANSGLSFTSKQSGKPDLTVGAKIIGELPAGSKYPNIYLQLTGLKALGVDSYLPGASEYDGKWIAIMADYLNTIIPASTTPVAVKKDLNADDLAELSRASTGVTIDYVFSADPKKAVFDKKAFIGKETVDGLNTYHYQVGLNDGHLKAYCEALVDKIYSTNAYKKLPWVDEKNIESDKVAVKKSCDTSSSGTKSGLTYDLWVDTKFKLIYKIRIPDTYDKTVYTDIGQVYKGGDEISMFATYHDGTLKNEGKLTLIMNLTNNTTKGTLTLNSSDPNNVYDFKIGLDAKTYDGEINVTKPVGAIPVADVLKKFGIDPSQLAGSGLLGSLSSSDTVAVGGNDLERQSDIKAIHGQVEAYYAQNGKYPTLANMNDAKWRSINLLGLDTQALRDSSNPSSYVLVDNPIAKSYAYHVRAVDAKTVCDNINIDCAVYTLTATNEAGGLFQKTNLN